MNNLVKGTGIRQYPFGSIFRVDMVGHQNHNDIVMTTGNSSSPLFALVSHNELRKKRKWGSAIERYMFEYIGHIKSIDKTLIYGNDA